MVTCTTSDHGLGRECRLKWTGSFDPGWQRAVRDAFRVLAEKLGYAVVPADRPGNRHGLRAEKGGRMVGELEYTSHTAWLYV